MSAVYPRLTAERVRRAFFPPSWRHGVHRDEVRRFLQRVAEEMDALHRDLASVRDENTRLKTALRDWQTRNARTAGSRRRRG